MSHVAHPLVSVCIPVYNGASYIAAAVNSVMEQNYGHFELIVLDNASTDETPQILSRFDDHRLRIIRHEKNIGAVANFNAALDQASAEWVKIVCADDIMYADCLEKQMGVVIKREGPLPVLISAARDIIDDSGRYWMRRGGRTKPGVHTGTSAVSSVFRAGTNIIGEPVAVLMHRETALRVGGFNPAWRFCTDIDLWVRILQQGDLYMMPTALCAFRVSAQSWSMALVHSQASEFCDWMVHSKRVGSVKAGRYVFLVGCINAYLLMFQRLMFYSLLARIKKR